MPLHFKTYVIRWYGNAHGLNGAETFDLFRRHGVIEYLDEFYDVLHTQSLERVVADVDAFISNHPAGT